MPSFRLFMPAVTAFTVAFTAVGTAVVYLRYRHHRLRSQVTSRTISAAQRKAAALAADIESLPQDLLDHPTAYRIIHEQDSIALSPTLNLDESKDAEAIFTRLMQRNMRIFATYLPQSYLMRLLAKKAEQKASFSTSHITSKAFKPEDVVCGFYRVLIRRRLRCEVGMDAPAAGLPESFAGRLVTSIVPSDDEKGWVLRTETLQWVRKEESMVLPLERGVMKWMHEFASWGLLVSGARWLEEEVGRRS